MNQLKKSKKKDVYIPVHTSMNIHLNKCKGINPKFEGIQLRDIYFLPY